MTEPGPAPKGCDIPTDATSCSGAPLGRALALVLSGPLLAVGCAASPSFSASGDHPGADKADVILKTEDVDREVGEEASREVEAELGLVDAPELGSYVNALGSRLVLHAPRRNFDYDFRIVDQDVPNAFALPGGFVFVSRGLLTLTNSEDELANVLCHEIIHVANRHAAGRQEVERTTVNPLMLPGVLLGSVLGEKAGRAVSQPFTIFHAGYIAQYNRDQEREADRAGQALCAKVGFDPEGMASFLRSLERTERLEQGFSRIPGFLATHPSTPERVGAAATRGQTLAWNRSPGISSDPAAYLERLDGLFVGVSPAEGIFDGERFLHADLDFAMRFPTGWHQLNSRRAVGAVSPKRDAEVFLEAAGKGDDPEAAAKEFLEQEESELNVQSSEALRVSGLPAYRVSGKTSLTGGNANVDLTFIAYQGLVYRVTGVWPTGGARYRGIIQGVARSFRRLGREERLAIRGKRLRLARAAEGETLEELSARSRNEWSPLETAVVNDLFAGRRLEAGRLVKVAISEPYRPTPAPPAGSR